MQPAFLRRGLFPPPSPGANILSRFHGPRAGCATDTRISIIVKRIVGNFVFPDVGTCVLESPFEQGIELLQAITFIPLFELKTVPCQRLLSPEARYPGFLAFQCAPQRQDLADMAGLLSLRDATVKALWA